VESCVVSFLGTFVCSWCGKIERAARLGNSIIVRFADQIKGQDGCPNACGGESSINYGGFLESF
jgi:hypothetical protein